MKKKKILSLLILTLLFFLPFSVKAEEPINVDSVKCPVIGQNPTYVGNTLDKYLDRLEERWVDKTDHKVMKSTDTFAESHIYEYEIGFVLKSNYQDRYMSYINLLNDDCTYFYGGSGDGGGRSGFLGDNLSFFIGDSSVASYSDDIISLNIANPTLGGTAPKVQADSRYTINSQKWYNITENKEMGAFDTFKTNTKYKFIVNYSSLYTIKICMNILVKINTF